MTAPTNHAADVIAEQLVRSGKFIQGEFVRFNGFLRHEQGMIESIRDYCVDGEYLDNVAQHRLIISTCATAGQFFSLNLTPGHFTHVFIDEAGYCTEPEAMISAVTLALDKGGQVSINFVVGFSLQCSVIILKTPSFLAHSCWRSQPTWTRTDERCISKLGTQSFLP